MKVVVIGDKYNLVDLVEIYLYKDYNVVRELNEFDGIKRIAAVLPFAVFLSISDDVDLYFSFMDKMRKFHPSVPVICFTDEYIPTVDILRLRETGVKHIVKFPVTKDEFDQILKILLK